MKRIVTIALGLSVVLLLLVAAGGWFLYDTVTSSSSPQGVPGSEPVLFEVQPGSGLRAVTRDLERQGLVRWAPALELYGRWRGYAGRLQAGRYLLDSRMAPAEVLTRIVNGDAVFDELTVTIPEGWSANDIELYFEGQGLFTKEEFQQAVVMQDAYRDLPLLAGLEPNTILDGYLFPDTYRIFPNSTPQSIVRRMLENFHQKIDAGLLAEIERQGQTLHEVLTLASIVQHEAAHDQEMPAVAGVFRNRLRVGMRLESDATVNYILGTNMLQPTFADTEVEHPFNTYENEGLPPGPIGNPGLPAIRAAVEPASHDYLFFLHKPTREIVLSRTFGEHLESKARYLD
ncbi:MAG: endolytic transglycosylase MltG [Alkalispirochaeta sp.]